MYAYGTDLTQLPYTDTMQKNPLYNPNQQQQQTRNTKKNNQQWGQGNWAYSQSPSPAGGSKAPDMSAWGKAQPIPPPSRGTPYGGDMAAWSSPQQARDALGVNPVNFGNGMWGAPGGEPLSPRPPVGFGAPKPMSQDFGAFSPPTFTYGEQQSPMGNWGNSQYGRPQGFQASYFDMRGNPVSAEQQQAQRAAMVLQLHQAQLPYVLGNAMNQNLGKPQFDFNTMLQKANEAVKNGFYNPFQRFYEEQDAIQRLGQQAPPSMYDPQQQTPLPQEPYSSRPQVNMYGEPSPGTVPVVLNQGSRSQRVVYATPQDAKRLMAEEASRRDPRSQDAALAEAMRKQQELLREQSIPPMPADYGNDWSAKPMPADYGVDWSRPDAAPNPGLRHRGDMTAPQTQPAQWKPMYGEYSPTTFYDDNGRAFSGSMSFDPGTSAEEQNKAYRKFAESRGFYNRDSNGNRIGASQPVNVSEGYTSEPVTPWMRPGAAQPVAPPSTGTPYGSPAVLFAPEPAKKQSRPQAPAQQRTYNPAQDEVNVYARHAEESSRRAQKELRDMQERFRDLPGKAAQLEFERRQNAKPWPRDKFGRLIRR